MTVMRDPYDEFEAYSNRQEIKLSKCPKCALCDEPIQDEYGYRLDGNLYCWDCALEWLRDVAAEYIDIEE